MGRTSQGSHRVPLICSLAIAICIANANAQMSLDVLKRDGYVSVPITRPEKNVLLVGLGVNGRNASLILDTGVSVPGLTIANPKLNIREQKQARLASAETVSGGHIILKPGVADSITFGNVEIKDLPVFLGGFASNVYADGLMGARFLRACSAVIDLHNLRLYLRPPGIGRPVRIGPALTGIGFAEAPFKIVDGACYVEVEVNDVTGVMVVDTGADTGLIDPRFAVRAKAHGYRTDLKSIDAAGSGTDVQLSRLGSFKIGGITPLRAAYSHVSIFSDYASSGGKTVGLLGIDILGPNGTIIDFAQQKLYFFKAR